MKVLIFGASGLTGKALTQLCIDHSDIQAIHLIVRKPLIIAELDETKVIQHTVDFSQRATLESLLTSINASHVFCCLGTTIKKAGSKAAFRAIDVELVSEIGQLALSHDAPQVFTVISALGADINSRFFYNHAKGLVEKQLKDYANQANGAINNTACSKTLIICRPSLLTGDRDEFRFGENITNTISKLMPFIYRGALAKYTPISGETLAQAMLKASLDQDLCATKKIITLENLDLHQWGS